MSTYYYDLREPIVRLDLREARDGAWELDVFLAREGQAIPVARSGVVSEIDRDLMREFVKTLREDEPIARVTDTGPRAEAVLHWHGVPRTWTLVSEYGDVTTVDPRFRVR